MRTVQRAIIALVLGAAGIFMVGAVLLFVGSAIDVADERAESHDRCMKHATNGYEIERCR